MERIKKSKLMQSGILAISFALVLLADIAASTSTVFLWHEPDCPEELLK